MDKIRIRAADDFHCHLRDGSMLARTVADEAAQFSRAIIMPNLENPVTTVALASAYRERILNNCPCADFTPLMTLYLTAETTVDDIIQAANSPFIYAVKLYPSGATTHSAAGITDISHCYPIFDTMQQHQLPLLIHGEATNPELDIFDREAAFIETTLKPLLRDFPQLNMVLEHITTKTAVDFIQQGPDTLAATITPHHLWYNRNQLFSHGINPHYYCLPILKRNTDQRALITAATSGHPRFFLGTDSAPHTQDRKECAHGCAGIYNAHAALPFYAHIFEQQQALDKLEAFASQHGANFYGLPLNQHDITLIKQTWTIPDSLSFGESEVIPMASGQTLEWQVLREN